MSDSTYSKACENLSNIIEDYRQDELATLTPEHVERWANQFEEMDRHQIVTETANILNKTYVSEKKVDGFLKSVLNDSNFTAGDPKKFWQNVGLLDIQPNSRSQKELNRKLCELCKQEYGVDIAVNSSKNNVWIYLDDGIFTGHQMTVDLSNWIEANNVENVEIRTVVIGAHKFGEYELSKLGIKVQKERSITVKPWAVIRLENRKTYRANSDVLWPTFIPDGGMVEEWLTKREMKLDHFHSRSGENLGDANLFSTSSARAKLEYAFMERGAYICTLGASNNRMMKPLGYSTFRSVGFGTLFCTYRNCPNNAPLVLWWGDPNGNQTLRRWYPLIQRASREFAN
ncbi:MAG: hypothetical protein RIC29_15450 [Rhodospirillaceae bacterium]